VNIPTRDIGITRSATETRTENIVGGDQEGNSDQRGDRECNSDKRVPESKALKSGAPALGGATHISSFADGGEVHLRTGLGLCTGAIYIVSNLYDHSEAHTDTSKNRYPCSWRSISDTRLVANQHTASSWICTFPLFPLLFPTDVRRVLQSFSQIITTGTYFSNYELHRSSNGYGCLIWQIHISISHMTKGQLEVFVTWSPVPIWESPM
jgi:hypothetical protein